MDVNSDSLFNLHRDSYCYHLTILPSDVKIVYQKGLLIIEDYQEMPPTLSPALQLVCIAQDQQVPIRVIPNHWRHCFIVEGEHIDIFIKTLVKAYPQLAAYLIALCNSHLPG